MHSPYGPVIQLALRRAGHRRLNRLRFRAVWLIHNPFATADIPVICTRLVDSSNKEQYYKSLQSFWRPDLDGEEIRSHNQFPVLREKFLPGRLASSLLCRFEAVVRIGSRKSLREARGESCGPTTFTLELSSIFGTQKIAAGQRSKASR